MSDGVNVAQQARFGFGRIWGARGVNGGVSRSAASADPDAV